MGRKEIYDIEKPRIVLLESLPFRYEDFLALTHQTDTDDQLRAWVNHLKYFTEMEPYKKWRRRTHSRNNIHEMRLYKDEMNLKIKELEEQRKLKSTLS